MPGKIRNRREVKKAIIQANEDEKNNKNGWEVVLDSLSDSLPTYRQYKQGQKNIIYDVLTKGGSTRRKSVRAKARADAKVGISSNITPPVSLGNVITGKAHTFSAAKRHPSWGTGLRVVGSIVVGPAVIAATDTYMMVSSGGTRFSGYTIEPSAVQISGTGPLKSFGKLFDRYKFRTFRLYYVPGCATSQVGQFSMGYCADPTEISHDTPNFSTMLQLSPSVAGPFWAPSSITIDCGQGEDTYFTNYSGDAPYTDSRLESQGQIWVNASGVAAGTLTVGYFMCDYTCDFYSPCVEA